jgi:two-component system OmpR family sensor kinase
MNPFRSVGARLGLGLAVVVAAALLLVDLIVVPSLEQNLIDSKLNQLRTAAPVVADRIFSTPSFSLNEALQSASESANARVVYYNPLSLEPPRLLVVADSTSGKSADVDDDPVALAALRRGELVTGTVTTKNQRYAEAAYYVLGGSVVLLRSSLHDTLRSINLVRSRLLIAGLIALTASLLVGYFAASVFARRIRRLEQAAERIADGDFGEPVTDPRKDELGQLAATFERMRQRLAQLEHARREFIANASHELRTPLFSLGGFLELMTEEDLDPKTQAEFTATMREQVDRLTKLAFRAVARATSHDLAVEGAAEATAVGDEERVLQIGRILVENALVHTPPGTAIRLRTARRNGSALLTVEDEGPGIPAEHAAHIFDRFYRIEGSVASGSGLGLAIARELAELMGGRVELHLIPGRTIFALVLPTSTEPAFSRENGRVREASLQ